VSFQRDDRIGPYRLVQPVFKGTASQIWVALHVSTTNRVALKIVLPDHQGNSEHGPLLKNEYTVGSSLNHESIIRILDYGVDRQFTYLVMEYFDAPNMKQLIRQDHAGLYPMIPTIIQRAAGGLAHLHQQGWIHRDIKPENFLINTQGEVRVIDLALAQRPTGLLGRVFRGKGKIQGTQSYISPEQLRGQPLDPRADIYSFGCVVYELISGKPPFTGESSAELLTKHLKANPPAVKAVQGEVTEGFARLVRRMMAKNPAERPATMDVVLEELTDTGIFA